MPARPKYPQTLRYRDRGIFMVSGRNPGFRKKFLPQNL